MENSGNSKFSRFYEINFDNCKSHAPNCRQKIKWQNKYLNFLPNSHKNLDVLSTFGFSWLPRCRRHFCPWFSYLISSILFRNFSKSKFTTKEPGFELNWEKDCFWLDESVGRVTQKRTPIDRHLFLFCSLARLAECWLKSHATFPRLLFRFFSSNGNDRTSNRSDVISKQSQFSRQMTVRQKFTKFKV